MPVLKYLADTNSISDVLRGEEAVDAWFDAHGGEIAMSTITLAEMRSGIELKADGKKKRELERLFQYVFEDYQGAILVFDEAAAFEWGRLTAEAKGRPLGFSDSLIAAIARCHELKVITRNIKDFPGCSTVDPWTGAEYPAWSPKL
jgi:predicted nucleic acid-binding protein